MTRQAVAKHLASLLGSADVRGAPAVVTIAAREIESRQGGETRYRLEAAPLADAAAWLERVGAAWDERLAALARHVSRGGDA